MPGSHDWRNRAASQIAQPLPDNNADVLTVLNPRAVDRHIWSKGEYERALELINQGYDKLIVAQIIDRTLAQLKSKLCYEQMEDGKRQQRRERINELRKRAINTPDGPRKNFRVQAQGIELAPARVLEERKSRQAAEYRDLTSEFFGDPRPGYNPARSQRQGMTVRGCTTQRLLTIRYYPRRHGEANAALMQG
jgi:hypothetical protein